MKTVERMFEGPLDVVGDIHGQVDALRNLLRELDYSPEGFHPEDRKLVFVGDLIDRGPDSVAVVEQVSSMVAAGNAQCVLGNHELNILRNSLKHDNNWFFNDPAKPTNGQRVATADERATIRKFFEGLPLALERDDLRVVHACWNHRSMEQLGSLLPSLWSTRWRYKSYEWLTNLRLRLDGCHSCYRSEMKTFGDRLESGNRDPYEVWPKPHYLHGVATVTEARQMGNPISVLTSGEEAITTEPFHAGGKFRFVKRVAWWDQYDNKQAVIVGHYWRLSDMSMENAPRATAKDLFPGIGPEQWLGAKKNVYCVDFSVGGRANGHSHETCRLAAVRWPEATVMFDNGKEIDTDFRR